MPGQHGQPILTQCYSHKHGVTDNDKGRYRKEQHHRQELNIPGEDTVLQSEVQQLQARTLYDTGQDTVL